MLASSRVLSLFLGCMLLVFHVLASAQTNPSSKESPSVTLEAPDLKQIVTANGQVSEAVKIVVVLTALSLLPGILVSMTAFVRIAVVLSMIRHAFGMPETPPNQVLVGLALFLTIFVMLPTVEAISTDAVQPLMANRISLQDAADKASAPLREFMSRQVRDADLRLMYEVSKKPMPSDAAQVSLLQLTPAFILNELRVSFQIGFVILLPFLLIDLVVSSVLLALGMLMVPPSTISLPLKVLMFVLIDGWTLVLQGVLGSFH